MKTYFYYLLIGLILLPLFGLRSQGSAFPVTAAVQSLPPFTPSLSDWADPSANRIGVTLLLNDQEEPSYQVALRMSIRGQGIELRTRPNFQPRPITLTFGQPVQLTAADLRQYFEIDNLDFIGYSRQAYLEAGGVPGGTYSICFEAVDFDRATEEAASREACTFVQARLLDPPVILAPLSNITPFNPQNLIVQWQARHTASFVTNYDVEIFAMDPTGNLTPEQIFSIQQPYVETTTTGLTTALINNAFPTLAQGQEYFLRVRAYDVNGSDAFKNDGFSELAFFTYGEACVPPGSVTAAVGGHDNAAINWQPVAGSSAYVLRVKRNDEVSQWYEYPTATFSQELTGLEAETEYLVTVQSVCSGAPGVFSQAYAFTTDTFPFEPGTFNCGEAVADFPTPAAGTPISALPFGTMVTIGNFSMKITSASAVTGGLWRGTGQVDVPFIGKKINVKFTSLGINTDRIVYRGNAFASGNITDAFGIKSPASISAEVAAQPRRMFCDSLMSAPVPAALSGTGTYSIGTPNGIYTTYAANADDYNPGRSPGGYNAGDYSNPNNPYTEENPFPATSMWNPYNVFSPYDPTDYTDPVNPWSAAFPYSGTEMLAKAAIPGGSAGDYSGGLNFGAANLPVLLGATVKPILIYQMQFTPVIGKLWAYSSAVIPVAGQTASFRANGVTFHPGGLQGESKMQLDNDLTFTLKSEVKISMKKGVKTHVAFDCNGLTGIGFEMTAEFCEQYVLAVDPQTGLVKPAERVKFSIVGVANDWTQMTAQVNLPPFALAKLPDWHFSVTNAVVDFSESSTPSSVFFPRGYLNPKCSATGNFRVDQLGNNSPEWTGFYLGEMTIKLPAKMSRDTTNPIEIGAYGMLIDEVGLTLNVYGTNLIPLARDVTPRPGTTPPPTNTDDDDDMLLPPGFFEGEGGFSEATTNNSGVQASQPTPQSSNSAAAGAWDLSLDRLGIGIQYSMFKYVAFTGKVVVPVFKDPLRYAAHIQPPGDNGDGLTFNSAYSFHVGLTDTVTFSAMGATLELHDNSSIGLNYDGMRDQFYADATFNGLASFDPTLSGAEANDADDTDATGSGSGNGSATNTSNSTARDTSRNRFNIPRITFQNFSVQSRAPYIPNIGSWQLVGDTQPDMGGFNVQLNEVGMFSKLINDYEMEVAFGVDLTLNLVPTEDQGFGAGGKAFIISTVTTDPDTKRQTWKFKKVRVDKLTLDIEGPAFKLKGLISFYEDKPIWGTGFKGGISLSVEPSISVAALIQFGNIDGHRYFFADAKVGFSPGLPLGQSGLAVFGFGGGVSYGMKREGRSSSGNAANNQRPPPPSPAVTPPADPELDIPAGFFEGDGGFPEDPATTPTATLPADQSLGDAFASDTPASNIPPLIDLPEALGVSLSGARYTPNVDYGIGVKALLAFGTVRPEVFNGDVMLEAVFTSSGGLATIALTGNANVMTPPKTPANPSPLPQIAAYMDLQYNFLEKEFDAMLEVKVYAAEGLLQGAYPNYVAGVGTVHANEDNWWIYMGTPTRPFMLDLDVTRLANMTSPGAAERRDSEENGTTPPPDTSGFSLGEIGAVGLLTKAYFATGTVLPDFPLPPNEVLSQITYTPPSAGSITNSGGFMAGMQFNVSMPDLTFLVFYANLNAGYGADIMMANYGTGARCAGNLDADEAIGINGWYGSGQAYAYLIGDLGIKADFFGSPLQVSIANVGGAALLETRLPNPLWMRGQLAGNYNVLNGALKGRYEFEFEAGEACDIVGGSELDALAVISQLSPEDAAEAVSVFAKPQVTFNFPVDAAPLVFKDEDGVYQYIKPMTEELYLQKANGEAIAAQIEWAADGYSVVVKSDDILPGSTALTFGVTLRFQMRPLDGTDADYTWMMRGVNTFEEETAEITFTTGAAPTTIAEENVRYTYPLRMQTNFHRDEGGQGYIQLDRGQAYLFLGQTDANISSDDYAQKIRFSQLGKPDVDYDLTYSTTEKRVTFAIPPTLDLGAITRYEILNIPIGQDAAVGLNVDSIQQSVDLQLPAGADPNTSEVIIRKMQASGVQEGLQQRSLYEIPFRTSNYATFGDKINAFTDLVVETNTVRLNATTTIFLENGTTFTTPAMLLDNLRETFSQMEGFDALDVLGQPGRAILPLMSMEADLAQTGSGWFRDSIKPVVYDPFPYDDTYTAPVSLNRAELPFGVPPSFALMFATRSGDPYSRNNLTEADVTAGSYRSTLDEYRLFYRVPYLSFTDGNDLKSEVHVLLGSGATLTPAQEALRTWRYPDVMEGDYRVKFSYRLPGSSTPRSTVNHTLNYAPDPSKK
jgi:hypothetical protein